VNYGLAIYKVMEQRAKSKLIQGPIVGLGSWPGGAPEGVIVCIHAQENETFSTAQKLANTISSDNTTKVVFERCAAIPDNEIRIVVGPPS
jgi:hypothetical protein